MKSSGRLAPVVLLVGLFFLVSAQAAYAATADIPEGEPQVQAIDTGDASTDEYGLHCEESVCALRIDMGDSLTRMVPKAAATWLEVVQENLHFLPDDAGIEIADELVLKMPVGDIRLVDADLTVQVGPDHRLQSLNGTAQLPLPNFGILDGMSAITPIVAKIGYDQGKNLTHVQPALQPDRGYVYFDVGAGIELAGNVQQPSAGEQQLKLSVPSGQRLTLVVDTEEPMVFFDGKVAIRYNGQLAYVRQVLDPTGIADWMPDDLPLTHTTTIRLSGALGTDLEQAFVEVGGGYAVDGGMIGRWLQVNSTPLVAEGTVVLNREGILLTGNAESSIAADSLFDGSADAQVFLPFTSEYRDVYVTLDGQAAIPFVGVHAEGRAMLDGDLNIVASANAEYPWQRSDDGSLAARLVGEASEQAQMGPIAHGSTWSKLVDRTVSGRTEAVVFVTGSSGSGYDWAARNAAGGASALGGAISTGYEFSSEYWRSLTYLCGTEDDAAAQEPVEVAVAKD